MVVVEYVGGLNVGFFLAQSHLDVSFYKGHKVFCTSVFLRDSLRVIML